MSTNTITARFELGKTLMTRGAQGALEEAGNRRMSSFKGMSAATGVKSARMTNKKMSFL